MEHHLIDALNGEEFNIFIDDLDLGWDNTDISNCLILCLLYTISYLNNLNQGIHIFVFLRTDMYKILMSKTQHSEKYRDVAYIRWDKTNVLNLVCQRIDFNFRSNK